VIRYVKDHIKEELNLDLAVHAVSVMSGSKDLLQQWFEQDITPLYSQRKDLKLRSIRRKLGALQQSVEMALRTRLRRKDQVSPKKVEQLRVIESELRQASGRLEEMQKLARGVANQLEYSTTPILRFAGATLVESWSKQGATGETAAMIVRNAVTFQVQEQTESFRRRMDAMAHKLHETLRVAAKVLEVEDVPGTREFSGVVREMPAFDLGQLDIQMRPPLLSLLGGNISRSMVTKRLAGMIGSQVTKSLSAYHALLYDWSERTLSQIQRRFDVYANSYRAQIERLVGDHVSPVGQEDAIRRDLDRLESARPAPTVAQ
jgi:hypothetical protein